MAQERRTENTHSKTVALRQHRKASFERFALRFCNKQTKPRCARSNGLPGHAIVTMDGWFVREYFASYCNVCGECSVNVRSVLFAQIKVIYFVPPNRNAEIVWAFQRNDTVFYPLIETALQDVEVTLM